MRLAGEAHYDGAVGQHGGAEESRPLYSQALLPGARSSMTVRDGAGGSRGSLGKKETPS